MHCYKFNHKMFAFEAAASVKNVLDCQAEGECVRTFVCFLLLFSSLFVSVFTLQLSRAVCRSLTYCSRQIPQPQISTSLAIVLKHFGGLGVHTIILRYF